MTEIEKLGLLKMDFLGLITLTDIKKAIDYVKEDYGVDIDFHKLGYEDPNVYELIASGDNVAVFQLESGGMSKFMGQLRPTKLEEIIAAYHFTVRDQWTVYPNIFPTKTIPKPLFMTTNFWCLFWT